MAIAGRPAGAGIDYRAQLIADLYSDDTSGIIRVASDSQQAVYTLGQFFAEWQVALAADRLGGLRVSRHDRVEVYLDGSRAAGDPASLVLAIAPGDRYRLPRGLGQHPRQLRLPRRV